MAIINQDVSDFVAKISILVLDIIWIFILTPLCIYHARNFWQFNCHQIPFFTKRHPKLVLFITVLALLYPVLFRPIVDYASLFGVKPELQQLILILISNIVQLYPIPVTIRVWLLYYDYNHALHSLTMKWKSQILPTGYKLPWYMTPRWNWMGNINQLSILGMLFAICLTIFIMFSVCITTSPIDYKI